ncbi:putative membrane protein [Brachybacterium muris]|uniref:hypothetical protein n=1 Tax=Brachybacterium muris TaxID=219301 RepID=UPI001957AD03|nr:hypothetical protein [Brachybacterium muris]MBM7499549.1 putative membrane protein [Brachybacterium muris]
MSERDGTSSGSRRPTYGLPGPLPGSEGPAPQDPYADAGGSPQDGSQQYGAQQHDSQQYGAQPGSSAHPSQGGSGYGTPGDGTPGQGAPGHDAPAYGPGGQQGPVGYAQPPKKRRRGIIPLVIGLVLLVVVAPLVTIGGLVWAFGSLASDTMTGPEVLNGGSGEVSIAANEMIIVYVPSEDAAGTTCTAESTGQSNDVVVTPTSGTVTLGDGQSYEQTIGVAALADSTVTVSCEGTDAPAYLGPYSLFGIAGPMLIGPAIGVLAGLVGLVLVIVGIVKLVRSRN